MDKPNASLSAERRGSLAYPDIDCFFVYKNNRANSEKVREKKQEKKDSNVFNYPFSSRKNFFSKLVKNPSNMWPVGNDWSFRNKKKYHFTLKKEYMEVFNLNL